MRKLLPLIMWVLVPACAGEPNPASNDPPPGSPGDEVPSATPMRRMTAVQLRNTVRDLFRGEVTVTPAFPASTLGLSTSGYSAEADANVVTRLGAEEILEAAEEIAVEVVAKLPRLLPCFPAAQDEACATSFIDTYGRRGFRRPLGGEERDHLRAVFRAARAELAFDESLGVVTAVLLQLPQFLYLAEVGEPTGEGDVVRLTAFEIASRLSYFFWDSMPDDALAAAADSGGLAAPEAIETQARRLLDDARSSATTARFVREWIGISDELGPDSKDRARYPGFDQALVDAFSGEMDRFVDKVVRDGGDLGRLLTSSESFVNARLASFYGLPAPPGGVWSPITLDAARRPGLLTKPLVLAGLSGRQDSSPIHRGKFVATRLLCATISNPPEGAAERQPELPPGASQRQISELRRGLPECAACHDVIDPIGLGLERYDAIGAFRDGVDATGAIDLPVDVAGPFDGAAQLSTKLAGSADVRRCFARELYRFALSRVDRASDEGALAALVDGWDRRGGALAELFVAMTALRAFTHFHGGTP